MNESESRGCKALAKQSKSKSKCGSRCGKAEAGIQSMEVVGKKKKKTTGQIRRLNSRLESQKQTDTVLVRMQARDSGKWDSEIEAGGGTQNPLYKCNE